ncbi:helix-turn-helix domain-containing protein [Marinomonas sp. TI.3.20]|uniref:IclR family transcriptional regulator n=1 Tax=Marinomonas sp. TI.3.20 TaxID=3121296 RepID=UPI00311E6450
MKTKAGAQINQSIVDGIAVLQALAGSNTPVGGKELSSQLGMDATRVNRLLKTLASIGMTQQNKSRQYTPGPGIHVLSAQSLYASGLLRSAIPSLEKLNQYSLTVALGVLWFDKVSYVYHAKPGMSVAEGIGRIGVRAATTSGIGMVLLANASEESVIDVYQNKIIAGFPDGLDSLLAELAKIREQGYAKFQISQQAGEVGSTAYTLAVALGNPVNSAIALQGDIKQQHEPELIAALCEAREDIERSLYKIKSEEGMQ